ncbi:hypothetical protein [Oceanobacillus sp. 1P07AA]|uniref:hypothetical protein n=1 Tax=Oceanobacillus sp. 1P07AA TaxID=3132293 RepID=UPI0039A4763F
MIIDLPIWFILSTNLLGFIFIYLGYRIWSRKQISLLGNIGKLKEEKYLNTVCKLSSVYSLVLGAIVMIIPMVNLLFDFLAVIILVGGGIIGSIIFWTTLQKVYFTFLSVKGAE